MTTLKVELIIWRLNRSLRKDIRYRERRAIRREVRANLNEAIRDRGERDAIASLGDLDELAAAYGAALGSGRRSFRPDRGTRALLVTAAVLLLVDLIRIPTFGTVETFDAHTGSEQWQWGIRYLWEFHGDARTGTFLEGTVFSPAFLLLGSAAFLVASRAWRYTGVGSRSGR